MCRITESGHLVARRHAIVSAGKRRSALIAESLVDPKRAAEITRSLFAVSVSMRRSCFPIFCLFRTRWDSGSGLWKVKVRGWSRLRMMQAWRG